MTNAEKYKEVFGLPVDPCMCPSKECDVCPCRPSVIKEDFCPGGSTLEWWNKEYKGNDTVKVEVTEVHTFAKPDDVSDIKFGDEE